MEIKPETLKAIMADYDFNPDIMCEDDDKVREIKYALTKLPLADKIIFCLQTDIQSVRKVGEILGVSYTTVFNEFKRIKNEIINIMENDTNWPSTYINNIGVHHRLIRLHPISTTLVKKMVENQEKYDSYIFVADMHAITIQQDPKQLKKNLNKCFLS